MEKSVHTETEFQIQKKAAPVDMEWVQLIKEAKDIGLTIEEIKGFIGGNTSSLRKD